MKWILLNHAVLMTLHTMFHNIHSTQGCHMFIWGALKVSTKCKCKAKLQH